MRALLAALVLLTLPAADWELLGTRRVSFALDHDAMIVAARTGPGKSIVRLQDPWPKLSRVSGENVWPFPNVTLMLYISRSPPATSIFSAVNPPWRAATIMAS